MEYATCHLYFPYTHKPLGKCVYEENTSDIPTGISKNFGNASNPLLRDFIQKRFMKILENLCQSSETFGKLWKQFKSVFQCFPIFGKFPDMIINVCNGLQELKSFRAGF